MYNHRRRLEIEISDLSRRGVVLYTCITYIYISQYLCSKNKDVDQLLGYRAADLSLRFRIYKKQVFS